MKTPKILFPVLLLVLVILLAACSGNSKNNDISVGEPAPDFSLTAADGSTVSLADFRGQPVLLFFHMAGG